ncbi:MAG TPA: C40 family peptidase, partial [Gaiellaceae bacterium]|nr:C40 family peptidase [Gaiellaceae bacterium]
PSRAGRSQAPSGANRTRTVDPPPFWPLPGLETRPGRRLSVIRRATHRLALGTRVVRFAKHLLGVPYHYGGNSPGTGFDCSGFVRYVYGHFGVSLAHSSFADFVRGQSIARRQLRPGDLVFFDHAGHVGIYVGGARFIHAPHSGTVVSISTMRDGWYGSRFTGARRIG